MKAYALVLLYLELLLILLSLATVREAEVKCLKEHDIDKNKLATINPMTAQELKEFQPKLNNFTVCVYQEGEIVDGEGVFNQKKLIDAFKPYVANIEEIVPKCVEECKKETDIKNKIIKVDECIATNLKE